MIEQPAAPPPAQPIAIIIQLDPTTGQLGVQSPPNLVTAMGMIELAKATILAQHQQQQSAGSPIMLARGGLPPNGIMRK